MMNIDVKKIEEICDICLKNNIGRRIQSIAAGCIYFVSRKII